MVGGKRIGEGIKKTNCRRKGQLRRHHLHHFVINFLGGHQDLSRELGIGLERGPGERDRACDLRDGHPELFTMNGSCGEPEGLDGTFQRLPHLEEGLVLADVLRRDFGKRDIREKRRGLREAIKRAR